AGVSPFDEAPRPGADGLGRVGAGVRTPSTVEADVHEGTNRLGWCRGLWHVVKAECDAVALQEPIRVGVMPGGIPKLDGVVAGRREEGQEGLEPFEVASPSWRQLVEHRAHVILEVGGAAPKSLDRLLGIVQATLMGEVAAGLDRVAEAVRRALAPSVKGGRLRQAVEGPVQLDGVEPRGVVLEPTRLRRVFGIERSAPVPGLPAGAAD